MPSRSPEILSENIHLHQGDIPADLVWGDAVAVDTETMGLNPPRDRLCLVQLSAGDGVCHLVRFDGTKPKAPHLKRLLTDRSIEKLFHFGRFDLAVLEHNLHLRCQPVYCTKIASKLARTYTDRHGLRELCSELLGVDLAKQQQSSDWGREQLSDAQIRYAACDVLYLHQLRDALDIMLDREGRRDLARACFRFLPVRVRLDLAGWQGDIFAHS